MNDETSLNLREKIAHIDQMLADHDRIRALLPGQIAQIEAETERRKQEMRFAPWQLVITGATAGAALFAAGAAFMRVFSAIAAVAVVVGLAGAASAQGFDPACRYGNTRADGSPCVVVHPGPAAPAQTATCAIDPVPGSSVPKCTAAQERAWCAAHPDIVARKAWKWQHGVLFLDDPDTWTPDCAKLRPEAADASACLSGWDNPACEEYQAVVHAQLCAKSPELIACKENLVTNRDVARWCRDHPGERDRPGAPLC